MPWRSGWLPSGSRINKGGVEAGSRGWIERMMGTDLATQGCCSYLGPSWPKAYYTYYQNLASASNCRVLALASR